MTRTHPQDHGRVETPTDVADYRDIAPKATLDRLTKQVLQLVDQRSRVVEPTFLPLVGEVEVPVLVDRDLTVGHLQVVPRGERLDPLEAGSRRTGAEKRE